MGIKERQHKCSVEDLVAALEPLGLVRGPRRLNPANPDEVTIESETPPMVFKSLIHARGVAIEVWIDGERACSMEAGEEVELVMYSLLLHQKVMAEKRLRAVKMVNTYFKEVKENDPDAWERFRNIGKEEPNDERPAE